ncbi:MAG TPA: hypothetical protein VF493_08050 [Terriglobales bacterium]
MKKKKYAKVVNVLRVESNSYDHNRDISGLVMHQLIHLRTVEESLPEEHRTGTNISDLHTEAEAAEYIGQVTAKLHQLGGKSAKTTKKKKTSAGAGTKKGARHAKKLRSKAKRK